MVTITSRLGDTKVLIDSALGAGAKAENFIGQQRYDNVVTGESGKEYAGALLPRTAGDGGNAVLARGEVSRDILLNSLATGSETKVAATAANLGTAKNLVGQTVACDVATGRSGYGTDVVATAVGFGSFAAGLDPQLSTFGNNLNATYRDAVVAVHDMENVVAALTMTRTRPATAPPTRRRSARN